MIGPALVPVLLDEDGQRPLSAVATRSPVTTLSNGSRPDSRVSSVKFLGCIAEVVHDKIETSERS